MTKPWYLPRATGIWRGIETCLLALGLRSADDVAGERYDDKGYRLEELGPVHWKNGVCVHIYELLALKTFDVG